MAKTRNIGERVRAIRLSKGMTQIQLAARAGIKQPALSSIETGDTTWLRGGNLLNLAAALEVSPKWLETGLGDPQAPIDAATEEAEAISLLRALTVPNRRTWLAAGRGILMGQKEQTPDRDNPFPKLKSPH